MSLSKNLVSSATVGACDQVLSHADFRHHHVEDGNGQTALARAESVLWSIAFPMTHTEPQRAGRLA